MPTYIAEAHANITVDGDNNVPVPSGSQSGDRFVVNVSSFEHVVNSIPAGWTTLVPGHGADGGASHTRTKQTVFSGIYDGSTPVFNVTQGASRDANVSTVACRDASTVDQTDSSENATSTTIHTTPSLTPSANEALILCLWGGGALVVTGTPTSPLVEAVDYEYWGWNYVGYYSQSTAAAFSGEVTSTSGQGDAAAIVVLLSTTTEADNSPIGFIGYGAC